MVTGVSCRYFHFQNGSTRTLLAAYAITVGETRARWQALASPGEKQCALLREHLGGWPSPPRGPEHRCALLAETYIWEGDGPQRGHRWWPEMVPDKCWRKVLSLPRKMSSRVTLPTCVFEGEKQNLGDRYCCINRGPKGEGDFFTRTRWCYPPRFILSGVQLPPGRGTAAWSPAASRRITAVHFDKEKKEETEHS